MRVATTFRGTSAPPPPPPHTHTHANTRATNTHTRPPRRAVFAALFFSLGSLTALRPAAIGAALFSLVVAVGPTAAGVLLEGPSFIDYTTRSSLIFRCAYDGVFLLVFLAFFCRGVRSGTPGPRYAAGHCSAWLRLRRQHAIENLFLACAGATAAGGRERAGATAGGRRAGVG